MPSAYLTTRGLKVSATSERLQVNIPGPEPGDSPERRWIPLVDVEMLVVDAGITIPTRTICRLLSQKIPILFLSQGQRPAGVAMPMNGFVQPLAHQLDACRDEKFALSLARPLVAAKIRNQRRVLQRLASNRKETSYATPWLNAMASQAEAAQSVGSLRGLEGAATGRYFEDLNRYFPEGMPFERRSRRPPHNPANALLSFLYTLIASELVIHLRACGLEPGWGVLHEPEDNRPSLALDLLEPFRAPVADSLTLDLLNHRRLTTDDFETGNGGWLLKRNSRRRLFVALEERLEREFMYEKTGQRTTIRNLMKDHCYQLKRAFRERTEIQPFVMN